MSQLFISHAEEDQEVAVEIGSILEQRGFGVWYYERDGVPGVNYLDQMVEAIEQCEALVLIISQHALNSRPVDAEVVRGFEADKPFVPLLYKISRSAFYSQKRAWRLALGAATSIEIPSAGLASIMDRIEAGVKKLGIKTSSITPNPNVTPSPVLSPPEDAVECTLFAPEVTSGVPSLVHAWLHSVDQANDVMRISTEFDAGVRRRAWQVVSGISVGTRVELALEAGKLPVKSLSTALTWQGQPEAVVFRVEPPQNSAASMELGEVTLYHADGIPLASLKFKIEITSGKDSTAASGSPLPEVRRYRKAFLSYANEDRTEVLRRAQILQIAGIEFSMDSMNLRRGEKWETWLHRAIDESDVFFLFWSNAAKHSKSVEKEWRYALKSKGPEFILPVTLELPPSPPPPELAAIHFNTSFAYLALSAEPKEKDS